MSILVRSLLVLAVGAVLGVTVSVGTSVLTERAAERDAVASNGLPPEFVTLLAEVMQRVQREYVESVDERKLLESAIRGMVEELDAHSRYLDEQQFEDIRISTTGHYSGIGLDVALEDGVVKVVTPIDDAPAARAGILPGDVVVAVDDMAVNETNLEDAVGRMRGRPGTEVELAVLRDGSDRALRFALTRAEIQINTVRHAYLGEGYGYLRIDTFSDTTAADLRKAAETLRREAGGALEGLALDLRNNPGGVLDAAIDVADLFLDGGLIVRGSGRIRQARFEEYAVAGSELEQVPLAVLVNRGSASASEIVAGALKDHGRATLYGERTYGKGSVQTVVPLGEGGAIKLTTSRYITPSGRTINDVGVEPDVRVPGAEPKYQYRGRGDVAVAASDAQLQHALRALGYDAIALSRAR